jgi:hypothetical protein
MQAVMQYSPDSTEERDQVIEKNEEEVEECEEETDSDNENDS